MRNFGPWVATLLIVVGVLLAAYGYSGALLGTPQSAVQQTVLELRLLNGTLGLLLIGIGAMILQPRRGPTQAVSEPAPPSDP